MATGRGRLLQLQWQCLVARPQPHGCFGSAFRSPGAAAGRAGFRTRPGAMLPEGPAALSRCAWQDKAYGRPRAGCSASLDSLPSEVLLKILSYLDVAALLCAGCVNRRFYHLASDNFIWIRIYSAAFSPKRSHWRVDPAEKTDLSVNLLSAGDKEAGYWKKEYLTKQIASVKAALARVLKPLHPHTGLPLKTKEALRMSGLGWVIILRGDDGREHTMEHAHLSFNDSSVTVAWHSKAWPPLATLSTLDLCGVTPVFLGQSRTPTRIRPRWHSLITKYQLSQLSEFSAVGGDRLTRVFCLPPGLVVGLWKREKELAFVMANLHLHLLVERSMLGSPVVPYEPPPHAPVSDDSPERGLHGYRLHVDMHSGGVSCLCGSFRNLSANKGCLENEYMKLSVISFKNNTEHLPLIGKVGLSWKTNSFDGCIKSCSIIDLTLLEEYGKPFWCFSSPVCVRCCPRPSDGPHFLGEAYCVDYSDSEGRLHMELVWIEDTEEYFIVSLALYLRLAKINQWFGTKY
ncbi:F-box only protein 15 isoform X1 [Odocoileus virginianus]|uniref:F-box only protein 15 isoform X1 n=2 Tax=Odocoileus virginianus TaxID=9874 RepID=A0ABM4H0H5_ODOVR